MSTARVVELYKPNDKGLEVLDRLEAALDAAVRELGHELTNMVALERLDLHEEGMLSVRLN